MLCLNTLRASWPQHSMGCAAWRQEADEQRTHKVPNGLAIAAEAGLLVRSHYARPGIFPDLAAQVGLLACAHAALPAECLQHPSPTGVSLLTPSLGGIRD